ncbi:MAG: hypothetical protein KIS92_26910 [Planctomycetota bacterium]|nr:hypothetical protein [Planctomycetota bacterium]
MTSSEAFGAAFVSLASQAPFAEATVTFRDGSRLFFCHRVGERWAKALGQDDAATDHGFAGEALKAMALFRLNAKHLDIQFADGSRWERKP